MITTTSASTAKSPSVNLNCLLRRNVETQSYGRCSVCTLQLRQCHAWQSSGFSFVLVVLALTLLLLPAGWPRQLVVAAMLVTVVWQGMANHRRTDELIHGAHRLLALTQELRGKQLLIEQQNAALAAQVDARTAELRESNRSLAAANLELLELDRLRSALISNVSHELRTPLTGILGSAQNLRDGLAGKLTDAQQEYVSLIESDSGRLIRVVGELLEWGRLEAGQIALRPSPVRIRPVVDEVAMLVRPLAQRRRVDLQLEASDTAVAYADPDKLRQILLNLVENAVKFSEPDSAVRVRVSCDSRAACVYVEDDGPGVPAPDRPHLFERFYRGQGAQRASGSGLGLAIARNLARLHGGDVTLEPDARRGSTFALRLPPQGAA